MDLPWSTCPAVATTCTSVPRSAASAGARPSTSGVVVLGGTASRSSSSRPPVTWPTTGGSPRRSALGQGGGQRHRGAGQHARRAPRRRRRRPRRTASRLGAARHERVGDARARAMQLVRCARQGRDDRRGRARSSVASRAARVSLSTRSARASGRRRSRSHQLGVAEQQPALRAAEQLVARGRDQRRARPQGRARRRARRAAAGAGPAGPSRCRPRPGRRAPASSATATEEVKPSTRKFDGCTLSTNAVSVADRRLVVGEPHPVGRTDLAQPGADRLQQLGDPEPVADLDQLAARDDDLAARAPARTATSASAAAPLLTTCTASGVGHRGGQGAQRAAPRGPRCPVARSSSTSVAPAAVTSAATAAAESGRPAEVGVHDDAGRVEDRAQRRRRRGQAGEHRVDDVVRRRRLPARHPSSTSVTTRLHQRRGPAARPRPTSRGSASTASVRGVRGAGRRRCTQRLLPAPVVDDVAEADGNRTRLTGMPGHNGFEDRARHQTRNASGQHSTTACTGARACIGVVWDVGPRVEAS